MSDPKDARFKAYMAQRALMSQFQNQTRPNAPRAPLKEPHPPKNPAVVAPLTNGGGTSNEALQNNSSASSNGIATLQKNDLKNNLMSREKLKMLIKKYGNEKCDPEVEEFLQEIVSDFVTDAITASCKLAMHRKGELLELKDVQMYLGKFKDLLVR
jgi:transcription initiation factor TFIID subunit TAF12